MSPLFISILFSFFLFFSLTVFSQTSPDSIKAAVHAPVVSTLIEKAWLDLSEKKSFEKRQWKKLLHIEKNALYRERSQVSDSRFFLSVEGYKNPETEMLKTLQAFFSLNNLPSVSIKNAPSPVDKDRVDEDSQHPICRFPARLEFLKSELPGDPLWSYLSKPECKYLNIFRKSLNAQSISYVFSSYYADSPGSAFGHTFFRVNKKEREGYKKQELLDYGISFAANVTTENPLLYAILGLGGGFTGTYTNVPYYYKVREYNDFESRDLWSYELNLTPDELELLILHFWEIGPHFFTYYFFTQNCSYQMLTALEAAAPRLRLTENMPLFIIPADSVKVLFKEPDFVKKVEFRPSLRRQFETRYTKLSPDEKKLFVSYVNAKEDLLVKKDSSSFNQKLGQFSQERKSLFLDAVLDYSDMKDPNGIASKSGNWYLFKEQNLLQRAKVDHISEELNIPTPEFDRPDISHPSSRIAIGGGEEKVNKNKKMHLEFRFALHDLMDKKVGLPKHSQLEFGNFKFSNKGATGYLEHFSFFKVLQLNPLTDLEKKISWSMDLGVKRLSFCSYREDCFGSGFKAQFGYALDYKDLTLWLLPLVEYRYGEHFDRERHRYALGIHAGVIYSLNDDHRMQFYHEKLKFNSNSDTIQDNLFEENHFEYRWNLSIQNAVSFISNSLENKFLYYHYF